MFDKLSCLVNKKDDGASIRVLSVSNNVLSDSI